MQGVTGLISISETGLENLDGLLGVRWADGGMTLTRNPALVDITGLDMLNTVTYVILEQNPKLERLPDFTALREIESLLVTQNDSLQELAPEMPILQFALADSGNGPYGSPWRFIQVDRNPSLTRLVLPRRAEQLAEVRVHANDRLQELSLGGSEKLDLLVITENPRLSSVDARYVQTADELRVRDNPLLSLSAFARVKTFVTNASGNADELVPY